MTRKTITITLPEAEIENFFTAKARAEVAANIVLSDAQFATRALILAIRPPKPTPVFASTISD